MSILITCSHCQNALRVPDEHAGRTVQCPRCAAGVEVPRLSGEENIPEVLPVAGGAPRPAPERRPAGRELAADDRRPVPVDERCPECDAPVPDEAERCPECGCWFEMEDEDEPPAHRRTGFKPCPRCGSADARRVTWTPWGSFYGPAMFHHVRCQECGRGYNGRTGGSNLLPAVLFVTVPLTLIVLILGALAYIVIISTAAP